MIWEALDEPCLVTIILGRFCVTYYEHYRYHPSFSMMSDSYSCSWFNLAHCCWYFWLWCWSTRTESSIFISGFARTLWNWGQCWRELRILLMDHYESYRNFWLVLTEAQWLIHNDLSLFVGSHTEFRLMTRLMLSCVRKTVLWSSIFFLDWPNHQTHRHRR